MKIGLFSDTHGWLEPKFMDFFQSCDEIWHCGDFGDVAIADTLAAEFKLRAVYGNIDGQELRLMFPEIQLFDCEGVKVLMTHIGGYPGRYEPRIKNILLAERPKLFVCGHSHITKVMYDKKLGCLHINPGAAGKYGFHNVMTAVRFVLEKGDIKDLELIECPKN